MVGSSVLALLFAAAFPTAVSAGRGEIFVQVAEHGHFAVHDIVHAFGKEVALPPCPAVVQQQICDKVQGDCGAGGNGGGKHAGNRIFQAHSLLGTPYEVSCCCACPPSCAGPRSEQADNICPCGKEVAAQRATTAGARAVTTTRLHQPPRVTVIGTIGGEFESLTSHLGRIIATNGWALLTSGRGGNNWGVLKAYKEAGGETAIAVYPANSEGQPLDGGRLVNSRGAQWNRIQGAPTSDGDGPKYDQILTPKTYSDVEGMADEEKNNLFDEVAKDVPEFELENTDLVVALPGGPAVAAEVKMSNKKVLCFLTPDSLVGAWGPENGAVKKACEEVNAKIFMLSSNSVSEFMRAIFKNQDTAEVVSKIREESTAEANALEEEMQTALAH